MKTFYDALGNGISKDTVIVNTGLARAGRVATVLQLGQTAGRAQIMWHLDAKVEWVWLKWFRVVES